IGGMAGNPVSLTLQDVRAVPVTTEYVTLECVSNNVGRILMGTGIFPGVSLKYLLEQVNPTSSATWAAFKAADGYSESLPLSAINSDPTILVAYELDGVQL